MLSNIRIVLVNTSHPGNIGAVARAMKNMALTQLYLVKPKCFPDPQAVARAAGAEDLLSKAVVCDDLDQAIADCVLVFGSTARKRSLVWPELTPRACSEKALELACEQPVAVLFGREDAGLANEELERCHYMVRIPSNPEYTSLNIAAAVQVVAYELYVSASERVQHAYHLEDRPVTMQEMEGFYGHLQKVMEVTGFIEKGNPRNVIRRMRRLFGRIQPDENEINILRGMLTAIEKALK